MEISVDPARQAKSFGFPRPFLLSHYSLTVPMRSRSVADRLFFTGKAWLAQALRPLRKVLGIYVFTERHSCSFAALKDLPLGRNAKKIYLDVLWQTHIMVDEMAAELRPELQLKAPAQGKNKEVLDLINQSTTPVSLHVRRGDCTIAATGRAVLPMQYYLDALAIITERHADPTLFVFSDDIAYVKEWLPRTFKTVFVDHNDDFSAHEDLRLMSSCHHHITANSTFSWWGAWLNPRADKIVTAPKQWYGSEDSYFPDLFPQSWVLIDVPVRPSECAEKSFSADPGAAEAALA